MTTNKLNLFTTKSDEETDFYIAYNKDGNVVGLYKNKQEANKEAVANIVKATKDNLVKVLESVSSEDLHTIIEIMQTISPYVEKSPYLKPFYNKYSKTIIAGHLLLKTKEQIQHIVKVLSDEASALTITVKGIEFPDNEVLDVAKDVLKEK